LFKSFLRNNLKYPPTAVGGITVRFRELSVEKILIIHPLPWVGFQRGSGSSVEKILTILRVSPNVGQKTGLNKVVAGTFEMGTDSSRFRSELKTTSSAS
jgi:hypothetical protein